MTHVQSNQTSIGQIYTELSMDLILIFGVLTPLSAISWQPVLVVEEAGVPRENHRPMTSNW